MVTNNWSRKVGLLVMALALGVSACGGASAGATADSGVATLNSGTEAAADSGSTEKLDPDQAIEQYQQCMKDNGVDVQMLMSGGGDGSGQSLNEDEPIDQFDEGTFDFDTFDEAEEKCDHFLEDAFGDFTMSPEQEAAAKDAELAFSKCMKEQGVDYTPFVSLGDTLDADDEPTDQDLAGVAEEDFEKFDEAAEACEHVFEELEGLFSEGDDEGE